LRGAHAVKARLLGADMGGAQLKGCRLDEAELEA